MLTGGGKSGQEGSPDQLFQTWNSNRFGLRSGDSD